MQATATTTSRSTTSLPSPTGWMCGGAIWASKTPSPCGTSGTTQTWARLPGEFSTMVPGHGARLLRVTPQGEIEQPPAGVFYEAEAATLTGSAAPVPCPSCSGGVKVGNIGGGAESYLRLLVQNLRGE